MKPDSIKETESPKSKIIRRILYWSIIAFFVFWISSRAADFGNVIDLVKGANLIWLIIALILQTVYMILNGKLYHMALRIVGYRLKFISTVESYFSSLFFAVATPIGGVGAVAYLSRLYSKDKVNSFGGAVAAVLMTTTVFYTGFMLIFLPALIYLDNVDSYVFFLASIAGGIFLAVIIGLYLVFFITVRKPLTIKKLFFKLRDFYQRVGRVKEGSLFSLSDDILEKNLQDFILATLAIRHVKRKRDILKLFLLGIFVNLWQLLILALVFKAFNIEIGFVPLSIVYSIFYVFTVISPTPSGIGFVEGIVQIVMVALGVPGAASLVVTLVYRAIVAWYPVLAGFIIFKKMNLTNQLID
jgi:uncharacterized protein (TIRG00374 family)